MIFVNLNFDELLGLFLVFGCLVFITIVVFNGIMRIFEPIFDEKFYWFGYKNRRRK